MKQSARCLRVPTSGPGLYEVTGEVEEWVAGQSIRTGLVTLFVQHTSASLVIQENADPDVRRDLEEFFRRIAPENAGWYRHTAEGSDDMPAHIRAALTSVQLSVPVLDGKLALGVWQGIYVFEHRAGRHTRTVALHCLGE